MHARSELLPWALNGGALGPMSVANGLLQSASTSLNRLSTYTPAGSGPLMSGQLGTSLGTLLRSYQQTFGGLSG